MTAAILHDDRWGQVIDRPDDDLLEIRWYDTTAELDGATFNAWLAMFAGRTEERRRSGVLVDSTSFRMDPHHMDGAWRDANIIPVYVRAGVRRFAFHMPENMPAIGTEPQVEGPATFPTAYFASRADALAWLAGTES